MYFFGSGFFHSTELAWDSGMLLCGAIVHCFCFLGTYSIMWTDWTPFTCWSTYVFSYNVIIYGRITYIRGFSDGSVGKEPACNAGDARVTGSIPGLGRCPGGGTATHFSILAWRIPWTEEPNRLWSIGRKESDSTEVTQHSTAQNAYRKVYTSYLTRWVNFHSEHACAAHTQMEKQERSSGLEDPRPPYQGVPACSWHIDKLKFLELHVHGSTRCSFLCLWLSQSTLWSKPPSLSCVSSLLPLLLSGPPAREHTSVCPISCEARGAVSGNQPLWTIHLRPALLVWIPFLPPSLPAPFLLSFPASFFLSSS